MSVEDVTAAAQKLSDDQLAAGKAAQLAIDQPLVDGLKGDLVEMTHERDGLQLELDALKNPPPPPPPAPRTEFGFNIWSSWNGYAQSSSETSAQLFARLKRQGFPDFEWGKSFYSSGTFNVPASYSRCSQGELDPDNPASKFVSTYLWTPGTLADKSHDAWLTTFLQSWPADKRLIFSRNEPDNNKLTPAQWPLYVADMNHVFDLKAGLGLKNIQVRDCFMNYSLQPASGPAWKDSWTNPAKRDGIIFDAYNNQASVDKTGATTVKQITDMLAHLGFRNDQCIIAEYGDRRPNDSNTPSGIKLADSTVTDTTRAAQLKTRYATFLAAGFEAIIAFPVVGSSGDHRFLDVDTASRAALASIMKG